MVVEWNAVLAVDVNIDLSVHGLCWRGLPDAAICEIDTIATDHLLSFKKRDWWCGFSLPPVTPQEVLKSSQPNHPNSSPPPTPPPLPPIPRQYGPHYKDSQDSQPLPHSQKPLESLPLPVEQGDERAWSPALCGVG